MRIPAELSTAGATARAHWRELVQQYDLSSPQAREAAIVRCKQKQIMDDADIEIARHGLLVQNGAGGGTYANHALDIQRKAFGIMQKLTKILEKHPLESDHELDL